MTPMQPVISTAIVLPPSVMTKADVARLLNELERVDNQLTKDGIHQKVGMGAQPLPTVSTQFADFVRENKLSLVDTSVRSALITQLRSLKDGMPVIHMTFAVEADPEGLRQIVQWLRVSVHPQAVVQVGLQPGLVAGVYLRTTNQVIDLSLRGALKAARGVLAKDLGALRGNV